MGIGKYTNWRASKKLEHRAAMVTREGMNSTLPSALARYMKSSENGIRAIDTGSDAQANTKRITHRINSDRKCTKVFT